MIKEASDEVGGETQPRSLKQCQVNRTKTPGKAPSSVKKRNTHKCNTIRMSITTKTSQLGIQSKLPNIGDSIFSVMSQKANEFGAINLSQGFPDFNCSNELIDLVHKFMKEGRNQYAPAYGVPELREILAKKIAESYGNFVNSDKEITITAGGTQAIFTTILTFVKEGDEVVILEPAYDSYVPSIKMAGGLPIAVPLRAPNYKIPWDQVRQKISYKTRMIIINAPHNPSGALLDDQDLAELKKIVEGTNILILGDEVYEHIVFDKQKHNSFIGTSMYERSISIFSFGKVVHATGWKVGYCVGPEHLMKEFRKVHQFNVFSVNTPVQLALAEFYKNDQNYLGLSDFYQEKRDSFLDLMKESRFKFTPTKGSYFQLMDFSDISDNSDVEFTDYLAREVGVAAIPISVFYSNKIDDKMIRFCFAKEKETLIKAAEALCKI